MTPVKGDMGTNKRNDDDANGDRPTLARITTGSRQLDEILGGGFPANSINIVMGEPGSGKTILAERLMFANANDDERPILFLTTLSEPLDKVVRYLQQFRFFDDAKLAGSIVYDSLGDPLAEKGIAALVPRLKDAITGQRPKIIILDSFKAIHDVSSSIVDMRRMLYEVAGLLTAYETTAFLIGEYNAEHIAVYPEFAVADSIIELARNKLGTRDERFLRVLKLRGSDYVEGTHGFRITAEGLDVYPRLVSPDAPPRYDVMKQRVSTGVMGLDHVLGGGLARGRSTFLIGITGAGKTTLALQFVIEGVRRGEQCMYVSFEENPTQLDAQLSSLGMDPSEARAKGLRFVYVSPVELQIDSIIATVFGAIRGGTIDRVVVDAVGDLIGAANDLQRLHSYLYALTQHFAVKGVTSLFPYEAILGEAQTRLSALADNIVVLNVEVKDGKARRTVQVVKARGIEHDLDVHTLRITGGGIEVDAT
jgi:circadian clock protein KaiC